MIQLFEAESQPFRKVHRMIDLFETIIKTHTATIVSNYFQQKDINDDIKGLLAQGLRVPSLGIWQVFSRVIMKEIKHLEQPVFIEGFIEYFEAWDKKFLSGGKNDIISFRNSYAHGATPSDDSCTKDVERLTPALEEMISAQWLKETSVIVFEDDLTTVLAIDDQPNEFINDDMVEKIKTNRSELIPSHPYLINRSGEVLDLFPLMTCSSFEEENKKITSINFFNDLKKKNAISLLNYPDSYHFRDKDIFNDFLQYINVVEWNTKTTDEFKDRVDELTEIFKGRTEEKNYLKEFFDKKESGFCFIFGNPGVGKSALIAQIFKELSYRSKKEKNNNLLIEYFIRRGTIHAKEETLLTYLNNRIEEICKTGIPIGKSTVDMRTNLHKRLTEASNKLENKKIILLIDGLDEGIEEDHSILDHLISETYKNILVVYGSRFTDNVEKFYNDISAESKQSIEVKGLNKNDIRAILYEVVNKYELEESFVEKIAEKSEGNPLYLKMLCLALEDGEIGINESIKLPSRVDDFYKSFLERYSRLKNGNILLQSLYLFAAAKDYLTQEHLELMLDIGEADSELVIYTLQEVLYDNPSTPEKDYQLFHESFREYLWQAKESSLRKAEKKIISFCEKWTEHDDPILAGYAMMHYSSHLFDLKMKDEIYSLAENREYIDRQVAVTTQYQSSFLLAEHAMQIALANGENDRVIDFGFMAAQLHQMLSNNAKQIMEWAKEGTIESVDESLKMISLFESDDQYILHVNVFYHILFNDDIPEEQKKSIVERVSTSLENIPSCDEEEIDKIMPFFYLLSLTVGIKKLNLGQYSATPLWKMVQYENIRKATIALENDNWYISHCMADNDRLEDLLDTIAGLGKLDEIPMLCIISSEYLKMGNKEKAKEFTDRALTSLSENPFIRDVSEHLDDFRLVNYFSRAYQIAETIEKRGEKGKVDEVENQIRQIFDDIKEERIKSELFSISLLQWAKQGDINNAIKKSTSISYYNDRVKTLCRISNIVYQKSELEKSAEILQIAVDVLENIKEGKWKAKAVQKIAIEYAQQGMIDDAHRVMNIIDKKTWEDKYYNEIREIQEEIIYSLTKMLKIEEAEDYVKQHIDVDNLSNQQARLFASMSTILFEKGMQKDAEHFMNNALAEMKKSNEYWKANSRKTIANHLVKQGRLSEANDLLFSKISSKVKWDEHEYFPEEYNDGITSWNSLRFIQLKNIEQASDAANLIKDSGQRSKILSTILSSSFNEDHHKKKKEIREEIYTMIESVYNKNTPRIHLAGALSKIGEHEEVEKLIEQVYQDMEKVETQKEMWSAYTGWINNLFKEFGNRVDCDRLIKIIDSIDDEYDKKNIKRDLIIILHEYGHYSTDSAIDELKKVINSERETSRFIRYMIKIATTLVNDGEKNKISDIMIEVKELTDSLEELDRKIDGLLQLSTLMRSSGDVERSDELIQDCLSHIQDEFTQRFQGHEIMRRLYMKHYSNIAIQLAEQKQLEKSFKVFSEHVLSIWYREGQVSMLEGNIDIGGFDPIKNIIYRYFDHYNTSYRNWDSGQLLVKQNLDDLTAVIEYLESIKFQQIKSEGYEAILNILSGNPSQIFEWIPVLLPKIDYSKDLLCKALLLTTIHIRSSGNESRDKVNAYIKALSDLMDLTEFKISFDDWFIPEETSGYAYQRLNEWLDDVEDEDDSDQIELWARKVKKGKMTEKEFEEKVKDLLL